jgi:hypothetical protein
MSFNDYLSGRYPSPVGGPPRPIPNAPGMAPAAPPGLSPPQPMMPTGMTPPPGMPMQAAPQEPYMPPQMGPGPAYGAGGAPYQMPQDFGPDPSLYGGYEAAVNRGRETFAPPAPAAPPQPAGSPVNINMPAMPPPQMPMQVPVPIPDPAGVEAMALNDEIARLFPRGMAAAQRLGMGGMGGFGQTAGGAPPTPRPQQQLPAPTSRALIPRG